MYRPQKDERLSWPSWMTCSGRFTHISGHPSAAGQAQDKKGSSAKYRRSTTVLRNQPVVVRLQISYMYVISVAQLRLKSWEGGGQSLGPNTGALAPRARPKAGLGVGCGGGLPLPL